jgi:MoaA/NifB/PqqE/SkfB family radical SAM enzyme
MKKMNPALAAAFGKIVNRAIKERAEGTGRPFLFLHLITNRCMCNCRSCLWKNNDWEEVPLEELKRFYKEAAEQGFLGTALSGGEPFLRKDLPDLAKFIKEETGMPILLFNTGWFLEQKMDEVLPYVDILLLSLDSASPEKYDEIRGLPGLFEKMMKGIDLVKKKYPDLPIHLNACVQKGITDEIDDLIRLTDEKDLRISFDVITEYRHGEGGSRFAETDKGLPLSELRGVCAYLLEKKQEGAPIINSEIYFKYFMDGKPGYKCHFPKIVVQLDGRGNMEYCLNLDQPIANIRETPLKEIMEMPRFRRLRAEAEDCCSCNSPTMVDLSNVWQNPNLLMERGGISIG